MKKIVQSEFGKLPNGVPVKAYTFTNDNGASVVILNLGGIIQQLNIPDKNGKILDIVCGFDSVEGYLTGGGYQGALIGRYANRINDGKFTLNGVQYVLAKNNNGLNHLHGGTEGFDRKIWDAQMIQPDTLVLKYTSPDGEEGYPGTLDVKATYKFDDDNALSIHYEAVTDKDTVLNLTNHAYFNLNGFGSGDVLSHTLFIDSKEITEVGEDLIPTGKLLPVQGTKYDFNKFRPITNPYDNNYALVPDGAVRYIAEARGDKSGISMEVYTNKPAIQLYDAVMMDGTVPFKKGVPQKPLNAFCLETQFYPDSPNHPNFPSCVLSPDEKYDYKTIYKFGIAK